MLFSLSLFADESFISNLEYGAMLYKNPRGIGCIKCHGDDGRGKIIATYINDKTNEKETLIAPNIKDINYTIFYKKVKESKILKHNKFRKIYYSIMPKYDYLTDKEIKAIYNYLRSIK